ncbi:MAG: hypothetical protein FJX99_08920 [Bacteroidetes bacterium]|nr:hypothetical protein [Bacteroidota bacterium]
MTTKKVFNLIDGTFTKEEAKALPMDLYGSNIKYHSTGNSSGISEKCWDILKKNKVFLKAPITTPQLPWL